MEVILSFNYVNSFEGLLYRIIVIQKVHSADITA